MRSNETEFSNNPSHLISDKDACNAERRKAGVSSPRNCEGKHLVEKSGMKASSHTTEKSDQNGLRLKYLRLSNYKPEGKQRGKSLILVWAVAFLLSFLAVTPKLRQCNQNQTNGIRWN